MASWRLRWILVRHAPGAVCWHGTDASHGAGQRCAPGQSRGPGPAGCRDGCTDALRQVRRLRERRSHDGYLQAMAWQARIALVSAWRSSRLARNRPAMLPQRGKRRTARPRRLTRPMQVRACRTSNPGTKQRDRHSASQAGRSVQPGPQVCCSGCWHDAALLPDGGQLTTGPAADCTGRQLRDDLPVKRAAGACLP